MLCYAGMTACILIFVLHLCGKTDIPVYDGAWLEWFKISTPEMRVNCPGDEVQTAEATDKPAEKDKAEAVEEKTETKPEDKSESTDDGETKDEPTNGTKTRSCTIL